MQNLFERELSKETNVQSKRLVIRLMLKLKSITTLWSFLPWSPYLMFTGVETFLIRRMMISYFIIRPNTDVVLVSE